MLPQKETRSLLIKLAFLSGTIVGTSCLHTVHTYQSKTIQTHEGSAHGEKELNKTKRNC